MTRATLKEYLRTEAVLSGVDPADVEDRVNTAIDIGLEDFWGSWDWYFKTKEATFTVTTTADNYALPDDFGGLIQMVEQASSNGGELVYKDKEEFDRLVPLPSSESSDTPTIFTVYQDDDSWRVAFFPRPNTTMNFNLYYVMDNPASVDTIPKQFTGGLVITCAKYIPRLDSPKGLLLEQREELIHNKLKRMNKRNRKPISTLVNQNATVRRLPEWADRSANIS